MKIGIGENFTKPSQKKGISLIVLIITIIVIIILAAVVILTITKNNPVDSAKEATFKEDVRSFQDELAMTVAKKYTDKQGQRDEKISTSDYDKIKEYIPSFTKKYEDKFIIQDDQLVGTDSLSEKEKTWANDLNISTSGKVAFDATKWDNNATDENCFLWAEDGTTITGLDETKLAGVTKIRIPSKCKVIRSDYAFVGTESYRSFIAGIEEVEIPDTVTELGYAAFHNFKNLVSIDLPDSITKIGENSFKDCEKLENVVLDKNLKEIGINAFAGCKSLRSIIIPESVTSVGGWAFEGCNNLTDMTIPSSVEYIGSGAFNMTAWYNNQEDGLIYINDILYSYKKGDIPGNTSIIIKKGTKSISGHAFDCKKLSNVTIPSSVTNIGGFCFQWNSSLTNITYNGTQEQWNSISKDEWWKSYSSIKTITCTDGVIQIN